MNRDADHSALRDVLAYLYPTREDARRIADQANLDTSKIDFSNKPINCWHSILKEAEKSGKLDNLISVILAEYGGNTELCKSVVVYLANRQDSSKDPLYKRPRYTRCWTIALVFILSSVSGLVGMWWSINIPFACGAAAEALQQDCERLKARNDNVLKGESSDEVEPNDRHGQAENLSSSDSNYSGYHNDENDYYKYEAAFCGEIIVILTSQHTNGMLDGKIQLQLYHPIVKENFLVGEIKGEPYHISYAGGPGPYFIRIYTDPGSLDKRIPYKLSVSFVEDESSSTPCIFG